MTAKPASPPTCETTTVPVVSDQRRAKLLASLAEAEASIEAGEGVDYDPSTFKARLIGIHRRRPARE